MPDGTVILLAAAGVIILLVSIRSRGQRAADRRPEATPSPPRIRSSYTLGDPNPESTEDFYGNEDEFAMFADEDDE